MWGPSYTLFRSRKRRCVRKPYACYSGLATKFLYSRISRTPAVGFGDHNQSIPGAVTQPLRPAALLRWGGLPASLVPGELNQEGAEPASQHGTHFYNRFCRHDLDVPPKSRNPVESQRDPSHGHDAAAPRQALGTAAGRPLAPCTPVHPGHGTSGTAHRARRGKTHLECWASRSPPEEGQVHR